MNNAKRKLEALKRKCGLTLPLAGVLTLGAVGHVLTTKHGSMNKTEVVTKNNTMTDQEKTDATLMSVLIMMEGCSLEAYPDDIGVWTYGVGSTQKTDGKAVKKGDTLESKEEAFNVADYHIRERVDYVFDYIKRDLTPEQKAALKSFAYNCGAGSLVRNGELTKLGKAVNDGNDDFVVREMLTYNRAGGSFMKGLFFRRALEAYIYQGFMPVEELQKCIIGAIGNVSHNKEMKEIFKIKETKARRKGRKFKIDATFDDTAVTDINVARKMLAVCQTPVEGKIPEKYAKFHIGELICEFLPENLTTDNDSLFGGKCIAEVEERPYCELSTLKLNDDKQVASIFPDFKGVYLKLKSLRDNSK